ncbi:MAG: O-antigen ligase family protein [Candidatus Saccharimonadales bacterium]
MEKLKKYLYWATIGLFAYMPFHIFLSQWLSTYTNGLDAWKIAKDVFTAILVSILVCMVLISRKYTKSYLILLGFAAVYLLLHIALLIGTNQPADTGLLATVYNNRLIWYVLIGYSLAIIAPKLTKPRRFVEVLLVASTVVCLFGFAQRFLPPDFLTNFGYSIERGTKPNFFIDDKPDLPRVFSTIRDPNSLGAFLILPSTIVLLALIRFWRTSKRMFLIGLLMLHGLINILTFSRSSFLGMLMTHVFVTLYLFKDWTRVYIRRFAIPIVILMMVLGGTVFIWRDAYFVQNTVFHADESTTLADPNELRVQLAQKGFDGVAANPEGNGPGAAGLVSTKLKNGGLLTENYYLQIAYEVGLVGLALFIGFLAYVISQLWSRRHSLITQALLASFIGLSFMNLLLHTWSNEAVAVSWFMLAGVVMGQPVRKFLSLNTIKQKRNISTG